MDRKRPYMFARHREALLRAKARQQSVAPISPPAVTSEPEKKIVVKTKRRS